MGWSAYEKKNNATAPASRVCACVCVCVCVCVHYRTPLTHTANKRTRSRSWLAYVWQVQQRWAVSKCISFGLALQRLFKFYKDTTYSIALTSISIIRTTNRHQLRLGKRKRWLKVSCALLYQSINPQSPTKDWYDKTWNRSLTFQQYTIIKKISLFTCHQYRLMMW